MIGGFGICRPMMGPPTDAGVSPPKDAGAGD
jgi:hypothetical protein